MDYLEELKKAEQYIFSLEKKINNLELDVKDWNRRFDELHKDYQALGKLYKEATDETTEEVSSS